MSNKRSVPSAVATTNEAFGAGKAFIAVTVGYRLLEVASKCLTEVPTNGSHKWTAPSHEAANRDASMKLTPSSGLRWCVYTKRAGNELLPSPCACQRFQNRLNGMTSDVSASHLTV